MLFCLSCREKADHLVHDLLEGTVFSNDYTHAQSQQQKTTMEEGEEAQGVVLKAHLRDEAAAPTAIAEPTEIDTNDKTVNNENGEPIVDNTGPSKATSQKTQVKMRNSKESGGEESRRQKFYRRLSFTHKDKSKANLLLRRSREAEDFEMVNSSELVMATTTTTTTTSTTTASTTTTTSSQAIVTPLQGSHTNSSSSSHHSSSTPKTFAGLFTLNRRASKRETPKGKYNVDMERHLLLFEKCLNLNLTLFYFN